MKTNLMHPVLPLTGLVTLLLSGCGDPQTRAPRTQYCSYSIIASKCDEFIRPPGPVCFDCTNRTQVCGFTNGTRVVVTFPPATNECELTLRMKVGNCADCPEDGKVAAFVRLAP